MAIFGSITIVALLIFAYFVFGRTLRNIGNDVEKIVTDSSQAVCHIAKVANIKAMELNSEVTDEVTKKLTSKPEYTGKTLPEINFFLLRGFWPTEKELNQFLGRKA